MKRTLLGGFAAAVLLLSAACSSSTSGTASAPSSTSSSSSSSSSSAAVTTSESSSSVTSSASTSSSSDSSTSSSDKKSQGTNSGSGSSSSSADTSPVTTKVIAGNLDGQSTAWFSTMCDGLAPLQKLSMSGSGATTGPNAMSHIGKELSAAGKTMEATAQKLAALPAPTVSNGAAFAGTFIKTLKTFGGELETAGQKVATGDTSSLTDFSTQADKLTKDVNSFKPSPTLEKQIEAIPSCKAADLSFNN